MDWNGFFEYFFSSDQYSYHQNITQLLNQKSFSEHPVLLNTILPCFLSPIVIFKNSVPRKTFWTIFSVQSSNNLVNLCMTTVHMYNVMPSQASATRNWSCWPSTPVHQTRWLFMRSTAVSGNFSPTTNSPVLGQPGRTPSVTISVLTAALPGSTPSAALPR